MSHIFPFNADKDKAISKKYTLNEKRFYIFYEKDSKTGW